MLGVKLRELRNRKNVLQKDIADYLSITVSTYQRYEYDALNPGLDTLIKLADYFNVSTDYLLGRTDNPNINR